VAFAEKFSIDFTFFPMDGGPESLAVIFSMGPVSFLWVKGPIDGLPIIPIRSSDGVRSRSISRSEFCGGFIMFRFLKQSRFLVLSSEFLSTIGQ
jgi:hypothetical protein